MKHTKGPWALLNYRVYARSGDPEKSNCFDVEIAECSFETNSMSHEEVEANATLISAAPDLLFACSQTLDYLVDSLRPEIKNDRALKLAVLLNEVIAVALGEVNRR